MTKYYVILENMPGCEMDRAEIEVPDGAMGEEFSDAAKAAIAEWTLSPGDTIRIEEAE